MKTALVLGADGYLGYTLSLHLAHQGYEVHAVDNLSKRFIEAKVNVEPLIPLKPYLKRFEAFNETHETKIKPWIIDIHTQSRALYQLIEDVVPEIVIHFAEQPSAPYSMKGRNEAVHTQINNIAGTLNLTFALKAYAPNCHLIKLGTMGEYGTPNIDIEEGWLELKHKGRMDKVMFPKKASSFYHLSKVHDSNNLEFASRNWGLRVTDLNQGIVYGTHTRYTADNRNSTSFHYDSIFGTVINRFIVQGLSGHDLTVYGSGNQQRAYLHIDDVIQCIDLAIGDPADVGEFKVRNQFTEYKSLNELASIVVKALALEGLEPNVRKIDNPRIENDDHYFNPVNDSFLKLGLDPRYLSVEILTEMIEYIKPYINRVDKSVMMPNVNWSFKA